MGRFNFNNYDKRKMSGRDELDIKRLTKELVHAPSKSYKDKPEVNKVGVILYFMNGQTLKTPEFTVSVIKEAFQQKKRWLDQQNGGAINLGYVVRYSPYIFYKHDKQGR